MMDDDSRTPDELAERFAGVIDFGRMRAAVVRDGLPARDTFTFRRVSELEMREPDWLVQDFIEAGSLALMVGDPGTGKSFCAISLAACVATGTPWHGHSVRRGPVLYVAGEGLSGIRRRCMAWELRHGVSLFEAPLFTSTASTRLTDEASQRSLRAQVERTSAEHGRPALIIIDTLARNFGPADENSTRDMNLAVAACDDLRMSTGAAILVIHHSSHADKNRGRGSVALRAAADSEFVMKRAPDGTVCLRCTKMKDAPASEPLTLGFERVDLFVNDSKSESVTSAVLLPTSRRPPAAPSTTSTGKNQVHALRVLQDRYAELEASTPNTPSTVSPGEWRRLCAAEGIDRRRFPEAYRGLISNGSVRVEGTAVYPVAASENGPNRTPSDVTRDDRIVRAPFRGSDVRTSGARWAEDGS